MRVAVDDDIGIVSSSEFRRGWASNLVTVTDVDPDAIDRDDDFLAQPRFTGGIGVAEDGPDRRNQSQLVQDVGAADIPRMKNEIDPRQRVVDAGPKEPMRIGDETNDLRFGG